MADRVTTIGTGGNYADPILWAAGEGNINDGNRAVGEMLEDITMTALFRPNQSFPNGGLLRGNVTVTGEAGVGRLLDSTDASRIVLQPTPSVDFQDLIFAGAHTLGIQSAAGNKITRCIIVDPNTSLSINADTTGTTATYCVLKITDAAESVTSGEFNCINTTWVNRIVIRQNWLLTIKNSNSIATDWILGPGTYTGATTLVNYCYIKQNAPAGDFGAGSSNNTINTDTTLEMVDFANGDYRIKSTSALATAGEGGTFVGAFLQAGGGGGFEPQWAINVNTVIQ